MQARPKATALTKVTWGLAAAFIVTSITLTVLATNGSGSGSLIDGMTPEAGGGSAIDMMMPPPVAPSVDPLAPPRADQPAEAAPATEAPAESAN